MNKQEFINAIKRSNDMELIVTQKNFSNFSHFSGHIFVRFARAR